LELAWPEAAAAWARSRAQLPEGARAELDAELARAARATGLALRDPLLALDIAKWIARQEERDPALDTPRASTGREAMRIEVGGEGHPSATTQAPRSSRSLTLREDEIGFEITSIAAVVDA